MEPAQKIGLPHVVKVRENKCLVNVKTTGNDIFGVLHGKAVAFF